jgi:hypothetical protein
MSQSLCGAFSNEAVAKLDGVKERDDLIASEAATQYRTGSCNDLMLALN